MATPTSPSSPKGFFSSWFSSVTSKPAEEDDIDLKEQDKEADQISDTITSLSGTLDSLSSSLNALKEAVSDKPSDDKPKS